MSELAKGDVVVAPIPVKEDDRKVYHDTPCRVLEVRKTAGRVLVVPVDTETPQPRALVRIADVRPVEDRQEVVA